MAAEVWLEASLTNPSMNRMLELRIKSGKYLTGHLNSFSTRFQRLEMIHRGNTIPLQAKHKGGWLVRVNIDEPGVYLFVHEKKPRQVTSGIQRFRKYLERTGNADMLEVVMASQSSKDRVKYRDRICPKTLFITGPPSGLKMPGDTSCLFELILESIPLNPADEGRTVFRVTFDEEPVGDVMVTGFSARNPLQRLKGKTDSEGRVSFPSILRGQRWLFSTDFLYRDQKNPDIWDLFNSTLTFVPSGSASSMKIDSFGHLAPNKRAK